MLHSRSVQLKTNNSSFDIFFNNNHPISKHSLIALQKKLEKEIRFIQKLVANSNDFCSTVCSYLLSDMRFEELKLSDFESIKFQSWNKENSLSFTKKEIKSKKDYLLQNKEHTIFGEVDILFGE